MKSKLLLLFLSLFAFVGGAKAGTYYAKLTASLSSDTPTGAGTVYVSKDNSYQTNSATNSENGMGSADVTFNIKAVANPGYKFINWIGNGYNFGSTTSAETTVKINTNKGEKEPLNANITAKFDHLKEVSNDFSLWYSESGFTPKNYDSTGSVLGVEVFSGNNNLTQGKQLYQKLTGLKNGYYKITWTAAASHANGEQGIKDGADIAERYVVSGGKDVLADPMTVWVQSNTELTADKLNDFTHTDIVQVTDGTLEYGIRNKAEGGNWYVCKAEKLEYLGNKYTAKMKIGDAKYGTFVAPFEVVAPEGVDAFTISGYQEGSNTVLELVPVENHTIDANTPVVVNAESSIDEDFEGYVVGEVPSEPTSVNNLLIGSYVSKSVAKKQGNFVLQNQNGKVQFFHVDENSGDIKVGANRAYLHIEGANVKAFNLNGTVDAVETIEALTSGKAEIFDLSGRKLDRLQKGINIVNGKKVMVK